MAQSKVKSVSKKINEASGQQDSWSKDGKTYYKFNYEMENGDIGVASHLTPEAKYKVGDELTYEKSTNNYGTLFKGLKSTNNDFKKGNWMSDDQSLRSTCINTVFILRKTSPEIKLDDAAEVSDVLFSEIKSSANKKEELMMYQSAMKIAREQENFDSLSTFVVVTKKIFAYIKGESNG